jgi:hypothetical protein
LIEKEPRRLRDSFRREATASDFSRCTAKHRVNGDLFYEPDEHLKRDAKFPPMRGFRASAAGSGVAIVAGAGSASLTARSREVGVATEMLLTKAEQVSDDGACAAGLRLTEQSRDGR